MTPLSENRRPEALSRIRSALAACVGSDEVKVELRARGGQEKIVAFVPLSSASPDELEDLAARLAAELPGLPLPDEYVLLARLPPPYRPDAPGRLSPVERQLATLWGEALGVTPASADDDFFRLGGQSAQKVKQLLIRIDQVFGVQIPLATLVASSTLGALGKIVAQRSVKARPAQPTDEGDRPSRFPTSLEQHYLLTYAAAETFWFHHLPNSGLSQAPVTRNVTGGLRFRGPLDVPALERALGFLLQRHEIMRTRFVFRRGAHPLQEVMPLREIHIPIRDFSGVPPDAREDAAQQAALEHHRRPLSRTGDPLYRADLFRMSEGDHIFLMTFDHIKTDGWSAGIFRRELAEAYDACRAGREPSLPPCGQYGDYALDEAERLQGEALERHRAYWASRLAGLPERPRLAASSGATPGQVAFKYFYIGGEVSAEVSRGLQELASREATTPFVVLLAAYALWHHRVWGETDVVITILDANRERPWEQTIFGLMIRALPVRIPLDLDARFTDLVRRAGELYAADLAHIAIHPVFLLDTPFDWSSSLFTAMFSTEAHERKEKQVVFDGLVHEVMDVSVPSTAVQMPDFDHHLLMDNHLSFYMCLKELVSREDGQRLGAEYVALLDRILRDPRRSLRELAQSR